MSSSTTHVQLIKGTRSRKSRNVRDLSPFAIDVNKAYWIIQSLWVYGPLMYFDHNKYDKQDYYWLFDIHGRKNMWICSMRWYQKRYFRIQRVRNPLKLYVASSQHRQKTIIYFNIFWDIHLSTCSLTLFIYKTKSEICANLCNVWL